MADYPKIKLLAGQLEVEIFLPCYENGYYRGPRFDWSGMTNQIKWNGHTFLCSSAVTADMDFRACGTAEELCMGIFNTPGPLGYEKTAVGGGFVKPGVGILEKNSDDKYRFEQPYKIIKPLKWDVQSGNNWIEFSQWLLEHNGWGYCYTKRITLSEDKHEIVIVRTLENLGSKTINATHYCHNYLLFDDDPVGPDYEVKLPFTPKIDSDELNGFVKIDNDKIGFHKNIPASDFAFGSFAGFDGVGNYSIVVENKKTKTGIKIEGDLPLERFHLYCQQEMICPEPFVKLVIEPKEKVQWQTKYLFYRIN